MASLDVETGVGRGQALRGVKNLDTDGDTQARGGCLAG